MIGGRSAGRVLRALGGPQHYRALGNMLRLYPHRADAFARYLLGAGQYPATVEVRTPSGLVRPRLYSGHDMMTVNEVFCRLDYEIDPEARVVVDIGSNIGISALHFLTRAPAAYCYLYEPDPRNVARLRENLAPFAGRWELHEVAVAATAGRVAFGTEPSGRYGGIGVAGTGSITVDCVAINTVLDQVLAQHDAIDLVKIDTEGVEVDTVRAMDPALLRRVRRIALEAAPDRPLHPVLFTQQQYGSVCRLTRRGLPRSPGPG